MLYQHEVLFKVITLLYDVKLGSIAVYEVSYLSIFNTRLLNYVPASSHQVIFLEIALHKSVHYIPTSYMMGKVSGGRNIIYSSHCPSAHNNDNLLTSCLFAHVRSCLDD